MLVILPAELENQVAEVAVNPLHVVAVVPSSPNSCQVVTIARAFYVPAPYGDVVARLQAYTPVVEVSRKAATGEG
ncbi:MAG TPA: hypothetical protein VF960_07015 [Chloroflexota bacterium]